MLRSFSRTLAVIAGMMLLLWALQPLSERYSKLSAQANSQRDFLCAGCRQNALSTTVQTVNGSSATLDLIHCENPANAATFLQIFNVAGTVTLGSTVPDLSFSMPASGGVLSLVGTNIFFRNAIKIAATTTATGSSAPATAIDCNFALK